MVPRWVIRMQELVGRLGAAMKSRASALLFLPSCSHHAPGATGRQRPTMTSTGISGWMMNPSFDLMPSELASFSPCFPHGHVRSETKTCRARRQGAVRNYQDLPRSMSQYQARVGLGSILATHLIRLGRPRGRGKGKHQGHLLLMEVAAQQAGVPSASLERNLASLASASEVLWSSADLGLAILPRLLPHIRVAFALGETRTRGGGRVNGDIAFPKPPTTETEYASRRAPFNSEGLLDGRLSTKLAISFLPRPREA